MEKTKSGQKPPKDSGNFKDDPERAAEAGRKGGQSSSSGNKGNTSTKTESAGRK
jgi:uncharacterized protein